MVSKKTMKFKIYKADGYGFVHKSEKRRITKLVMRQLFEIANRFDGTSKIKITFTARGNI